MIRLRQRLPLFYGLFDAGVVSLGGFLTNLLAGRYLSTTDYGLFAFLYALATIALVFQGSLISGPYAVLSQSDVPGGHLGYFGGSFVTSTFLGIAAGGVCLGLGVASLGGKSPVSTPIALWPGYFAYVLLLVLQDFARRVLYSHRLEGTALFLDSVSFGGQLMLLIIFQANLTIAKAMLIFAGTTLLALLVVLARNCRSMPFRSFGREAFRSAWIANWGLGRWNLASSGVSWIANQLYIVTVTAFQPAAAAAQLNAARTVASISNPLVIAIETMGTPHAVRALKNGGPKSLRKFIVHLSAVGVVLFGAIGGVFYTYPEQAIQLLFRKSFGDIALLVQLFSLMPVLWLVGRAFTVGVQSMQMPKTLFPVYAVAAILTVTIGVYLTRAYGALGGALGLLVNSLVLSVGFGIQFFRVTARSESTATMDRGLLAPKARS